MESEAPGGSAVFDYASDAYRGFTAKAVLENDARPQIIGYRRLGEFLVDEFLECLVGRWDTYYDWDKKTLVLQKWPPSLWYHLNPKFLIAVQVEGKPASPTNDQAIL